MVLGSDCSAAQPRAVKTSALGFTEEQDGDKLEQSAGRRGTSLHFGDFDLGRPKRLVRLRVFSREKHVSILHQFAQFGAGQSRVHSTPPNAQHFV